MTVGMQSFTTDDLAGFPEGDNHYEVIDGELYLLTVPHYEHQWARDELTAALRCWCQVTGRGLAISGAGLILSPHDSVVPDLMWFSLGQLPQALISPDSGEQDGWFHLPPELVVEVLSPGAVNEERDREIKLTLYSRRGVREYWLVDHFTRTVAIYRRGNEAALILVATLTEDEFVTSPLLPEFSLPVSRLFLNA